jgi:thioredoxin reductase (NADPH)
MNHSKEAIENVVIIGSGPAGHTAAIYAARAMLTPLMYEGEMAGGVAAGGQLTTTTDVENYPGFPDGISGPELMMHMRQQSLNNGARIETKTIDRVDLSQQPYTIYSGDNMIQAHSLIITTGATAKRLGITGEDRLWQKGMSACAVCDGGLPLFRNNPMIVIGGGDSACEEAHYLTKFASHVYLVVRRDQLRASKVMQQRVLNHDKITLLWNTEVTEVLGDTVLEKVTILNNKTQEKSQMDVNGLFYAIGHTPNTPFLDNQLDLDEAGYITTKAGTAQTSKEGVFAGGDVQDKKYRQAVTSAGTGCMAALEAEHYLTSRE